MVLMVDSYPFLDGVAKRVMRHWSAPLHYSYGGYTLRPERLLHETVPSIVERMRQERVDAVVLVPV